MHNKSYKKAIVFALCLTMLAPLGSMAVSSAADSSEAGDTSSSAAGTESTDSTADAADETAAADEGEAVVTSDESADAAVADDAEADAETTDTAADDEDKVEMLTNEQAVALESCEQVAENDNFILYSDEENERLCLYVKKSGRYWWTSPINVDADETIVDTAKQTSMKSAVRKQVASSCAIKVGDLRQEKRTESAAPLYSNKARITFKTEADGVAITYKYSREGVTLTVHYQLCDDNLYVYCDTSEIVEDNISTVDGKILTKLQLAPYFAAVPSTDETGAETQGYMIVPDGSGAVINYNNGKGSYPDYNQQVYGRDYTAVPLTAPRVTEQAYLPVLATVNGSSGIVAVCSDGDSNVYARAQVSGQNKQVYNNCYFEFETRSSDAFFMSGDSSNKITVFEKDNIKTDRFGVRYYAVDSDNGEDVNYADCAAVYRNYLINEKGLTAKAEDNSNNLYLDLYGGVIKRTSICGLPFNLKTEITGFDQAGEIVDELKSNGVDTFTVNYNDWTNASIKGKISTEVKPSGTLGGSSDFEDFLATENATVYPSLNNFTMNSSSSGYFTLTSTAIRISNAYSRQSSYSLSFGVAKKGVAPALLSPNKYTQAFEEMIESYGDEDISNAGFGLFSSRLVGDYTRKEPSSRNKTMNTIVEQYAAAQNSIGSLIADEANAYVLPYVSTVTNVPVSSSGFNVTDYDIPFYQMVLHGYVPYSSTSINKSSNSDETFLLSIASGSQIHYDMTYVDADTLQDTDYNDLYYTNYKGWTELAAKQYKAANDVLSAVSGYTISKYEVSEDGNQLTTTYSKDGASDVVITVDKANAVATVDGKTVELTDCIEGGLE